MADERIEEFEQEVSSEEIITDENLQVSNQLANWRWSIADWLVATFFIALAFGMSMELLQATIVAAVFIAACCSFLLLFTYPMNRRRNLMRAELFLNHCLFKGNVYALLAITLCLVSLILKLVFPSTVGTWEHNLRFLFQS